MCESCEFVSAIGQGFATDPNVPKAVRGSCGKRVVSSIGDVCVRAHVTMASAAQCAWQSVVFRFLHTGVVNDVSRVIDCAQKFVLHVNELLSLHRNTW